MNRGSPGIPQRKHQDGFVRRNSHRILEGGWLSSSSLSTPNTYNNEQQKEIQTKDDYATSTVLAGAELGDEATSSLSERYATYPLVQNMILTERIRTAALESDGQKQIFYTKSNEGWFRTLFVLEGRALDQIYTPWMFFTLNAVVWTCISELVLPPQNPEDFIPFEGFVSLVATATLSFLLVFRLNRSAERYWVARQAWGNIIAYSRTMVSGVLVEGRCNPAVRDDVIRWIAAFAVSNCTFMHGNREIPPAFLTGIINEKELLALENSIHPPIHCMDEIRWNLHNLFHVDADTPVNIAYSRTQQKIHLEELLDALMINTGSMERIKSTPLPLVYVTHLRTWLFLFLFFMPYIWSASLGWITIPTVCLSGFAYLGLDGAAREVEAPFQRDRVNHLSMDAYVLLLMKNILQQIREAADRDLQLNANHRQEHSENERNESLAAPTDREERSLNSIREDERDCNLSENHISSPVA